MEIKIYDNAEEIGKEVGSEFVKAVNAKPSIVLGLATGASPIPTYKYICEQYKNGLVSLMNMWLCPKTTKTAITHLCTFSFLMIPI